MKKILLSTITALLCFCCSICAQNEMDKDVPRFRSCRMGKANSNFSMHRSRILRSSENPYIGNRRQLVVLAAFQDQAFAGNPTETMTKWDKVFNARNFNEEGCTGSISDYFLSQSYGQFNLAFDLVYIELPDGRAKYRSTNYNDENSQYLVDDIVDALEKQNIRWSDYDWDGDSYVDQLIIVYAGKGMNAGGDANTIWPHQWWLSMHENLETADPYDRRSYRTVTDGETSYNIDCYCCAQEMASNGKTYASFGTICHEYSHCLGLPDFYNDNSSILYTWDLMDSGCYNGSGMCPCNYSAHERMAMGWLSPIELTSPTSIALMPPLSEEPVAYLIRNDAAENEFYILENRQKTGWDQFLPADGIVIFHIEFDEFIWKMGLPNSNDRKRYHIIPANNKTNVAEAKNWAYPYIQTDNQGNNPIVNDSLTDTSKPAATLNNPNVSGKLLMSKPITKMALDANGLASFTFLDGQEISVRQIPYGGQTDDAWYLPDGRRLHGQPTAPGLYISNGRKVVVN